MRCSPEDIRCFCILPPIEIIQSYVCSYYLQTKGNQKIKNTVQAAKQPPSAILYFLITKTSTESQDPPVLSLSQVHIKRKNKRRRKREKEGREGERENNTCFLFILFIFSLPKPYLSLWRVLETTEQREAFIFNTAIFVLLFRAYLSEFKAYDGKLPLTAETKSNSMSVPRIDPE